MSNSWSRLNGRVHDVSAGIGPEPGTSGELPGGEPYSILSLSLRDLFGILWKRLWVIALVTMMLVGAAVGYSLVQTPMYEASAKVLVGQQSNVDNPFSIFELEGLTKTVAEGVNSLPVANAVIEQVNLRMTPGDLLSNLRAEQVNASQFVQITYTDSDPQRAQRVVNAVGEVLSRKFSENEAISSGVTVSVWERAVVPGSPVSPDLPLNALAGLIAGVILGVSLALVREYLDDSWRSPEEAEEVSGVPTFGVIPEVRLAKQRQGRVEGVRPFSEE